MVVAPSNDVDTALDRYDSTLTDLLDKHAPLKLKRLGLHQSARRYDSECRVIKRLTRPVERKYRRLPTDESLVAWRCQFRRQRLMYQYKFTTFWSSMIDSFERNPRALWTAVNGMLQPPQSR
jgi:hypothetical protein